MNGLTVMIAVTVLDKLAARKVPTSPVVALFHRWVEDEATLASLVGTGR